MKRLAQLSEQSIYQLFHFHLKTSNVYMTDKIKEIFIKAYNDVSKERLLNENIKD